MGYVRGDNKPKVDCILCAIVEGNDKVDRLEAYRTDLLVVSLNLYPYSPGHLLLFPKRHVTDPRMLNEEETQELCKLQTLCLDVIDEVYHPHGFNLGYNIGDAGGASIPHLHMHVVPRYRREIGFIDIIASTKIIVEDPNVSLERVRAGFAKLTGKADDQ